MRKCLKNSKVFQKFEIYNLKFKINYKPVVSLLVILRN